MMERYLVTGAGGNLARQLVEELSNRGKQTLCVDLTAPLSDHKADWRQVDITDVTSMTNLIVEFRPQCILHMASLLSISSEKSPLRAWRVNATATVELLELAAQYEVERFFFPSTSATYGGELPDPLPEDHPQWPENIYGATKVAVERVGTYFSLNQKLDFRSVRLPIVVSPFAPETAVSAYASQAFISAARGNPFIFPVAPSVASSIIYVRDVIQGILQLIEVPMEQLSRTVYNLHGFRATTNSIGQAAEQQAPGFQYQFEPDPLSTMILAAQPSVYIDDSARIDWGWSPQFDLLKTADDIMAKLR